MFTSGVDVSPYEGIQAGVAEAVPEVEEEDACDKTEEVGVVGDISSVDGKEQGILNGSASLVTMCENGNKTCCKDDAPKEAAAVKVVSGMVGRKNKRKELKKVKRKQIRQEVAVARKVEEESRLADPEEQARIQLEEQQEAEALAREQAENDRLRKLWLERDEQDRKEAERRVQDELAQQQEEEEARKLAEEDQLEEGWEYVDDGPAQIIWQGNEIIFKKPKKKVLKAVGGQPNEKAQAPSSNPLPPQGTAFAAQRRAEPMSPSESAEKIRNFGTEQDKTHCPFHIKTGVCRFGVSCSRAHVYPDKSCTLLIRNMYTGPGLAWEHEDGLEYTEEEVYDHFEEFYDDVHEEFQKSGELVNFKVCRNASSHLRGNVYVQYRSNEDAMLAYSSLNGRYYASKQITCEFVGVTRWRVAICGEYMRAKYRPCSRGTVCNFLHCFRNPRGEYAWADWDLPAPRFWQCMMDQLFGCKGGTKQRGEDVHIENGDRRSHRNWASDHLHKSSRSRARSHSSDREDDHRQSPDSDVVDNEAGLKRPRTSSTDKLADRGEHSGSRSRLSKSSTRGHSSVDKSSGGGKSGRRTTDPSTPESEDERAFQRDRSRTRRGGEDRPSRRERSRSRSRKRARHFRHEEDVKEDRTSCRKYRALDSGDEDGEEPSTQVGRWRSSETPVESDEEAASIKDGSRSSRRRSRSLHSTHRKHKAHRSERSFVGEAHDPDDRWQC